MLPEYGLTLKASGTPEADTNTMISYTNSTSDPYSVNKQGRCSTTGRKIALDEFVIVNEIGTVLLKFLGLHL